MRTRSELVTRLGRGEAADVLIVGGGINGVGTFRDLAAQGVPSLLVEANDFASGATAAPSRLIHGGLRYLETGEAALVRESLTERNLLLKNACHVVHPQPVWVPLRTWTGGTVAAVARFLRLRRTPGPKGAIPVKIGLMIYDVFGRAHQTMPDHRMLTAKQARSEMPVLAGDTCTVAEYFDARITHPERLVMELVADAEADCPDAMAVPYLAATGQDNGHVTLTDTLTGATFAIRPRIVVNASGAWVDEVQHGLGFAGRLMGGTRGSHLVFRHPRLAADLKTRMLYFETADHRACLIYPLDDRHVFVGTTDIRTDDPDDKQCTEEEIDYLLDILRPVLPGVSLRREDIVFAVAGVRPLPFQDVRATGAISRDHRIDIHPPTPDRPFETLTLVGGKWTTYRAFAEQVADAVLARLGRARSTDTAELPIGGARGLPRDPAARAVWAAELAAETGLGEPRCDTLVSRYGANARAVAEAEAAAVSRNEKPGDPPDDYSAEEIGRICRTERVTRLDDVVLRRTLMGFEGRTDAAALERIGRFAATALDWDGSRLQEEIVDTLVLLRNRHRVPIC